MKTSVNHQKLFNLSASLVLALLFLYPTGLFLFKSFHGFAWDFSINWTAAMALREGIPLYNAPALQSLAFQYIGNEAHELFTGPFKSFISLPTTAILMLPYTVFPYDTAVLVYRICTLLAFLGGIILSSLSLSSAQIMRAAIAGAVCLVLWDGGHFSLALGQVDGWIVLALGAAVFGVSRGYWRLVGISIGVATLLKISPGLLLVYCVLKRQWAVVFTATTTLLAGLLLCWLPHNGADLQDFLIRVLPSLGEGTRHVQNQALGALLARLTAADTDLLRFSLVAGAWKYTGICLVSGLLLALWRQQARVALQSTELACVILLALLAGPISWDHYFTWALVPATLLVAHARSWPTLCVNVLILVPFYFAVPYIKADVVAAQPWWRLFSSGYTLSALAMFATGLLVLQRIQRLG